MADRDFHEWIPASLASRREALGTIGATALLIGAPACGVEAQTRRTFTPEMFGARGDGVTDDYAALKRLAAAVNAAGGGLVRFGARRRYLIDRYQIGGGPRRNDVSAISYNRCRGLTIDLNGSTISVKGDFHRAGDTRRGRGSHSSAVVPFMINRCTDVTVANGELTGNADRMTRDPQVSEFAGHGMSINGCQRVVLRGLHIHHFSNDGVRLGITSNDELLCSDVRLEQVRLTNNARQGLTNAGASGVVATDSHFSHNGRTGGPYRHPPSAGVDIEPIRRGTVQSDFRATRCRFDNNYGGPVVAADPRLTSLIELVDCSGRTASMKRMILVAERTIIRGGSWHNIQIACAYAAHREFNHGISVDVSGGVWSGDHHGWSPIYDLSPRRPQVRIHRNRFELRSPRPFASSYMFQCANPNHRFEDNQIFVARSGHSGSGDDMIGGFQNAGLVRGNRWSTDASGAQRFVNVYTGADRVEDERFSGNFVGRGMH